MRPVWQTKFGEEGNCLQACLASILHIGIEAVPETPYDASGWVILDKWLTKEYDLFLVHVVGKYLVRCVRPCGYHLIGGLSDRGLGHSVVGYDGIMVHDPHPESSGLVTIEDYSCLAPATPGGEGAP